MSKINLNSFKFKLIVNLGYFFIKAYGLTIRFNNPFKKLSSINLENKILFFWHSDILLMPYIYQKYIKQYGVQVYNLSSEHKDGQIIANIGGLFGLKHINGSSSSSAVSSSKTLIKLLKNKNAIAITPDGPRGPANKTKIGLIKLALISKSEFVPMCIGYKKYKTLNSWDKFLLPLPFSKANILFGDPVVLNKENSIQENQNLLDDSLNQLKDLSFRF